MEEKEKEKLLIRLRNGDWNFSERLYELVPSEHILLKDLS